MRSQHKYFPFTFAFIKNRFGFYICNLLKQLCNLVKLSVNIKTRIKFINSCLKLELIPPHLYKFSKSNGILLHNNTCYKRLERIQRSNVKAIMRLELRDAYCHLHSTRNNIFLLYNTTFHNLPFLVTCQFFKYLDQINSFHFSKQLFRINKKTN